MAIESWWEYDYQARSYIVFSRQMPRALRGTQIFVLSRNEYRLLGNPRRLKLTVTSVPNTQEPA